MAQRKELYRVDDCHFENVPFLLRGMMGYLFKKDLNKMVDAINCERPIWKYYWVHESHWVRRDEDYEGYIKRCVWVFFMGWNRHRIVKYRLDLDAKRIEGYCPLLKDSKIWIETVPC